MSRICEALCPKMYENPVLHIVSKTDNSIQKVKKTKAPIHVAITTSRTSLTMHQYAFFLMKNYPNIDIGRQRLYNWFRQEGIIPKNSRIPDKRYVKEGLFEVRYADTMSPNRYEPVAMISPKGQQFFTRSILNAFQKKTA